MTISILIGSVFLNQEWPFIFFITFLYWNLSIHAQSPTGIKCGFLRKPNPLDSALCTDALFNGRRVYKEKASPGVWNQTFGPAALCGDERQADLFSRTAIHR
jgi:hypothetical protein